MYVKFSTKFRELSKKDFFQTRVTVSRIANKNELLHRVFHR